MRLKKALFWSCLCVILFACSDDPKGKNFNYLRSPSFFRADTASTAHSFCNEIHPFTSKEECLKAKKYHLTWTRPEDTAKLLGFRVYLDTTDPKAPAGKKWEKVQGMPELASIIIPYHTLKDSVVFVFGNGGFRQDTLKKGVGKIFVIDSVTREDGLTGNLDFALVPVYGGDVTPGKPQFSYFITRDKAPPDGFHPFYAPMATRIKVSWQRPTDRISFFDPSLDTGIIRGYYLKVELDGRKTDSRKKAFRPKLESFIVGGKDLTGSVTDSLENDSLPTKIFFRLPDSNRASKRTSPNLEDSLFLVIGNLTPQDTLKIFLFAIDSAGNRNDKTMETVSVLTTDTTQPSRPELSVDSVSRNGFQVKWSASSDSIEVDGKKIEAEAPNANIQLYRLTRILQRPAGAKTTSLDRIDTTVEVDPLKDNAKDSFSLSMRFLPPGSVFHLKLMAVDRSGFESTTDTLTVTTASIRFAGADSALVCPPGLIPVPRGRFKLGDQGAGSQPDERNGKVVNVAPYCIEPYEHRDSTGKRFVSNVTYDKAAQTCEDMAPDFKSKLCSEIEWERACEGSDSIPLLHGIQSEGANASILQSTCNQGTNDSAMAMSFELRNATCLTTEGIYDLAGNLSEWVRDPYHDSAYALFTKAATDTIDHEFTFGDSTMKRHGIRGGNYLKTNFPQQVLTQNLARCSNRDFPQQVRPIYKPECVSDDSAKVAIIYGPGLGGHRCVYLGALASRQITEIKPSAPRDANNRKLLVLIAGVATPDSLILPSDTAFDKRRPLSAKLTTRSLVEVVFERADGTESIKDTLDASEMRDTSQAALERIFRREAGNDEWKVRKVDGKFQIKFMYGYSIFGTKPAQPFYSSRVIGFRCCSLAITKVPVPTDSLPAVVANP